MVKYLKSLKPPQFSWNFPGKKTEKLSGIYFSSVAPPQPIIIYIIIHITSHHTNTNTTPHTMSAFSTMFTHSGDVVDPTGDTVAQIKGETDPQSVAAAAAAPEPPAQVAPPAAQDLLDPAPARARARALVQQAQEAARVAALGELADLIEQNAVPGEDELGSDDEGGEGVFRPANEGERLANENKQRWVLEFLRTLSSVVASVHERPGSEESKEFALRRLEWMRECAENLSELYAECQRTGKVRVDKNYYGESLEQELARGLRLRGNAPPGGGKDIGVVEYFNPETLVNATGSHYVVQHGVFDSSSCENLARWIDTLAEGKGSFEEDFKTQVTEAEVEKQVHPQDWSNLKKLLKRHDVQYTKIMVRCWTANPFFPVGINVHTDHHGKVLQVALSGARDHAGGELFYLIDGVKHRPERLPGTIYVHDNTVAHGVEPLTSGTRYSLYFLQDPEAEEAEEAEKEEEEEEEFQEFQLDFTPSGDVVDLTDDIVAQISRETDPQPVAASAAAPEQPAQVAPPAAQDPPPPAQDPPPPRPELDFITAVKFEEESKSLDFRCSVEGGEIRVKLLHVDTKGANTGATKIPEAGEPGFGMPVEMLANLVLEKTIYAIMENEKEAIQKYLKEA